MRVQYSVLVVLAAIVILADGYLEVLSGIYDCAGPMDLDACLESRLAQAIDDALDKNETYRLNQYTTVTAVGGNRSHRHPDDDLSARFLDFFNALQIQYEPDKEDDGPADDSSEGTTNEGRKRKGGGGGKFKNKHKMGYMMGFTSIGMTIIGGLFSKMMMGGAISIAIKALIIAKIALLLAGTMAIKKLLGGSFGGGGGLVNVHPTWTGGGGGGGNEHQNGYRRSFTRQPSMAAADVMAYRDQIDTYTGDRNSQ